MWLLQLQSAHLLYRWQAQELYAYDGRSGLESVAYTLVDGFGWSTFPGYLYKLCIERGELQEIPAPVGDSSRDCYLIWTQSA